MIWHVLLVALVLAVRCVGPACTLLYPVAFSLAWAEDYTERASRPWVARAYALGRILFAAAVILLLLILLHRSP